MDLQEIQTSQNNPGREQYMWTHVSQFRTLPQRGCNEDRVVLAQGQIYESTE